MSNDTDMCPENRRKNCVFVDAAVTKATKMAVKDVFAILGVDIDNPSQVEQFRISLRFSDSLRKLADRGMLVFAGAVALMVLGAIITGFITSIHGE